MFNPNVDKIAVCIPEIKLKKNPRFIFKKFNEPYIISLAIDANDNNSPKINYTYRPFPNVLAGNNLPLFGEGFLVYAPNNPGDFLITSILIMESNKTIQETGETIEQIICSTIKEQNFTNTLLSILSTTTKLPTKEILDALTILINCIAKYLKNKKDVELLRCEGTFLKGTNPPYSLGRPFQQSNTFIELSIEIIPLCPDIDNLPIDVKYSPRIKRIDDGVSYKVDKNYDNNNIVDLPIDVECDDIEDYDIIIDYNNIVDSNLNSKYNTYTKIIDLKSLETS